jgi:hypothetical protein
LGPALRARCWRAAGALLTLAPPPQVKRLERSGMSQAQAEELTSHICEVVAGTLERLEAKFATKTEAERVRRRCRHAVPCGWLAHASALASQTTFLQETAFSMFKASIQTDLEHQKTAMKRDCDAVRTECDKLRTGAAREPARPRAALHFASRR